VRIPFAAYQATLSPAPKGQDHPVRRPHAFLRLPINAYSPLRNKPAFSPVPGEGHVLTANLIRHEYLIKNPGFSGGQVGVRAFQFLHQPFLGRFAHRRLKADYFRKPAPADKSCTPAEVARASSQVLAAWFGSGLTGLKVFSPASSMSVMSRRAIRGRRLRRVRSSPALTGLPGALMVASDSSAGKKSRKLRRLLPAVFRVPARVAPSSPLKTRNIGQEGS